MHPQPCRVHVGASFVGLSEDLQHCEHLGFPTKEDLVPQLDLITEARRPETEMTGCFGLAT